MKSLTAEQENSRFSDMVILSNETRFVRLAGLQSVEGIDPGGAAGWQIAGEPRDS
jgi:hypothetical protein